MTPKSSPFSGGFTTSRGLSGSDNITKGTGTHKEYVALNSLVLPEAPQVFHAWYKSSRRYDRWLDNQLF